MAASPLERLAEAVRGEAFSIQAPVSFPEPALVGVGAHASEGWKAVLESRYELPSTPLEVLDLGATAELEPESLAESENHVLPLDEPQKVGLTQSEVEHLNSTSAVSEHPDAELVEDALPCELEETSAIAPKVHTENDGPALSETEQSLAIASDECHTDFAVEPLDFPEEGCPEAEQPPNPMLEAVEWAETDRGDSAVGTEPVIEEQNQGVPKDWTPESDLDTDAGGTEPDVPSSAAAEGFNHAACAEPVTVADVSSSSEPSSEPAPVEVTGITETVRAAVATEVEHAEQTDADAPADESQPVVLEDEPEPLRSVVEEPAAAPDEQVAASPESAMVDPLSAESSLGASDFQATEAVSPLEEPSPLLAGASAAVPPEELAVGPSAAAEASGSPATKSSFDLDSQPETFLGFPTYQVQDAVQPSGAISSLQAPAWPPSTESIAPPPLAETSPNEIVPALVAAERPLLIGSLPPDHWSLQGTRDLPPSGTTASPELAEPASLEIAAAVPDSPPPAPVQKQQMSPMMLLLAVGLGITIALFISTFLFSSAEPAPNPSTVTPAVAESKATAAGEPQVDTGPYGKYLEVVGLRVTHVNSDSTHVKFIVVNHSPAEIEPLQFDLNVQGKRQILAFSVKVPSLGPYDSSEITAVVPTAVNPTEIAEWRSLKSDYRISVEQ